MRYLVILSLLAISAPCVADGPVPPNPSMECFVSMQGNPEFAPLKGKMMLGIGDTPLEILANNTKPNKTEKVALSKFASAGEQCSHLGDEWRATYLPLEAQALFDSYMITTKDNLADLYGGKITYGEYAKTRDAVVTKFKADVAALKVKLMAQQKADQDKKDQEAQRHAEVAQRQNAEQQARQQQYELQQAQMAAQEQQAKRAALLQILTNQQQQQQENLRNVVRPPPITTRCNTYGTQTNCYSQ